MIKSELTILSKIKFKYKDELILERDFILFFINKKKRIKRKKILILFYLLLQFYLFLDIKKLHLIIQIK